MRIPPSQSILIPNARRSLISEGIYRYDVTAVMKERNMPIQKYQPHVVYWLVTPAKKIPMLVLLVSILRCYRSKISY